MGAQSNGKPVEIKQEKQNGSLSKTPSHKVVTRRRAGPFSWLFSTATRYPSLRPSCHPKLTIHRLFVYYAIFVALFRCPSSVADLNDDSSRICKPYLVTRSHITPYVKPYYDTYASQYVEAAMPYVEKIENTVVAPAWNIGKRSYETWGAPRVQQAELYGRSQWEKTVRPQLTVAQLRAKKHYDATLAPHVDKASAAAAPYYSAGRDAVYQTYNDRLLPAYAASLPYAKKAYHTSHKALVETGYPYARWSASTLLSFLNRTVLPKVKILYGENVEPQLMKISQRLGRYRDGKKIVAAVDEVDKSAEHVSASSSLSSASSSIASSESTPSSSTPVSVAPAGSAEPISEEKKKLSQETATHDLETWEEKFLHAADTAADDLMDRVDEIVVEQNKTQIVSVGESLVVQLEETATKQTVQLKKAIHGVVEKLPEQPSEDDVAAAEDSVNQSMRNAGLAIRSRAQELRSWKEKYVPEVKHTVYLAAESTLEVLTGIKDLGLQEIGMKWAWMDGITYKEWAKYHDMRKNFDKWRNEIGSMAMEHDGLRKLIASAEDVEARGMAVAEDAATELLRLKDVAAWKIQARDVSDDWSNRAMPAKAAAISKKVQESAQSVKENIVGTTQGSVESVYYSVSDRASSKVSEAVSGSSKPATESIVSAVKDNVAEISKSASEAVVGTPSQRQKRPFHLSLRQFQRPAWLSSAHRNQLPRV
jgi:hypothetical protein